MNTSWRAGDPTLCVEIAIIDDDVEEIPEIFQLHLDVFRNGQFVRAENQTLTVIMRDNG